MHNFMTKFQIKQREKKDEQKGKKWMEFASKCLI